MYEPQSILCISSCHFIAASSMRDAFPPAFTNPEQYDLKRSASKIVIQPSLTPFAMQPNFF
jgi:hypothetical protein